MRFKYYKMALRQMKLKKSFVLFVILLLSILILLLSSYFKTIRPTLKILSEAKVKELTLKASTKAVKEAIKGVKYSDLINIEKDKNGKIISLSANVEKINTISNEVITKTWEGFENSKEDYIEIPIGTFLGITMFGGHGFKVRINTLPVSISNAEFKSEFKSCGINQTIHKISLEVKTEIKTVAPFYIDTGEYINEILVAETIIVGDTPNTYYNVEGLETLSLNDTLNMVDAQ